MIKVAIIDDGVNNGIFQECITKMSFRVSSRYEVKRCRNSYRKDINHGTICAGIISKDSKSKIELISIKVKNQSNGELAKLIVAIEYCIQNKIQIVNISLGSTCAVDEEPLRKVIQKASDKGLIIVAALSNDNHITYPASLENTIGVRHTDKVYAGIYYYKLNKKGKNIFGLNSSGNLQFNNNKIFLIPQCNSFATAMLTKQIIQIVEAEGGIGIKEIVQNLIRESINM